jgi:uncharacterized protein (DUF433 family)
MSEKTLDMQVIFQRLAALEENLEHLRQSLKAFVRPIATPQTAQHPYIETVPEVLGGEPVVKGTRTPVRAIVEHWKFGDSPEEILRHLPHLRLAEVFDVLSYYDDHREEIERYIALNRVLVDE